MITGLNSISPYGLCGVTGFLLGIGYLLFITRVKSESFSDLIYAYVWAALGAIAGAKLLYLFIELPNILQSMVNREVNPERYLKSMISGGFVFYGGLLGAAFAVKIISRYFALDYVKTISVLTPAMPLAHALGRVGCALVGCCYGRETRMCIGVCYTDSLYAPNGVPLIPVQILEATADLIIFGILVFWLLKKTDDDKTSNIFELYVAMYASVRFLLEFLRGDSARGRLGWLSTSQWISIILLGWVAVQIKSKRKCIERK